MPKIGIGDMRSAKLFGIIFVIFLLLLQIPLAAYAQNKFFATPNRGVDGARATAQIHTLLGEFTRMHHCTALSSVYAPTHPDANAQGCINSPTSLPVGAVVPFDLASCPDGWAPLASASGRFIVGVGTLGADSYALGDVGGSAAHTLTIAEMPTHTHRIVTGDSGVHGAVFPKKHYGNAATEQVENTGQEGGNSPHENRPPFVALLYCTKQ